MVEKHADLVHKFYDLKVKEVMDSRIWDLPIIKEDEPLDHVLFILSGKDHLWVVKDTKGRELVGVITEKDFLQIISPPRIDRYALGRIDIKSLSLGTVTEIKNIMSKHLVTASPDMLMKDAITTMIKYKVRRLPVLEGKILIGELTLHDIINTYSDMVVKHEYP